MNEKEAHMDRCDTCKNYKNEPEPDFCTRCGWVFEYNEDRTVKSFTCGGYEREENSSSKS